MGLTKVALGPLYVYSIRLRGGVRGRRSERTARGVGRATRGVAWCDRAVADGGHSGIGLWLMEAGVGGTGRGMHR